jgi:hypothetical protein
MAKARGRAGKTRRVITPLGWALRGAAAGAAGTTALNAVTYLDMAVRGRPSSSTPQQVVETIAEKAHVTIPGDEKSRENRVEGLGPLAGLGGGVVVGMAVGLARATGFRTRPLVGILLTTVAAMVPGNGPTAVLGITDPRSWSTTEWLSDVVPHLAYGVVVKTTMDAFS